MVDNPVQAPGHEWLRGRLRFGIKTGLSNMRALGTALGNPWQALQCVSVVGSNGKGSTALWLSSMLSAHGIRTGLFTSPHLVSLRERMRCDGACIEEEPLEFLLCRIRSAAEHTKTEPTFFEVLTLAALLWFRECGVHTVVLEAGLGGRLDSTNIADASLVLLTSIGLEHTDILGGTREAILAEKLGVLRPGAPLFHSLTDTGLVERARQIATEAGASDCLGPQELSRIVDIADWTVPVPSDVFTRNALLAAAGAKQLLRERFQESLAAAALAQSQWPGRMQFLPSRKDALFLLDGAHNPPAAEALAHALPVITEGRRLTVLFAALADKDVLSVVQGLLPLVDHVLVSRTAHPRMRPVGEVAQIWRQAAAEAGRSLTVEEWDSLDDAATRADALIAKMRSCGDNRPVLCTGSLYLIGALVELWKFRFDALSEFRPLTPDSNEWR